MATTRYACEACGCDVTADHTIGGALRWLDTRGSSLCPSWTTNFHVVGPCALPIAKMSPPDSGSGVTVPQPPPTAPRDQRDAGHTGSLPEPIPDPPCTPFTIAGLCTQEESK